MSRLFFPSLTARVLTERTAAYSRLTFFRVPPSAPLLLSAYEILRPIRQAGSTVTLALHIFMVCTVLTVDQTAAPSILSLNPRERKLSARR